MLGSLFFVMSFFFMLNIEESPLDTYAPDIDGKVVDLRQYKGKVVMVVNVASKCGYTPQYADLESLYRRYRDRGFVILGFPANDFREQEPGTNAEIKDFCKTKFDVTFPMFSKVSVVGDRACDLYKWLVSEEKNPKFGGRIQWNFTKFLLDKDANVVARFEPGIRPMSEEVIRAVEKALDAK